MLIAQMVGGPGILLWEGVGRIYSCGWRNLRFTAPGLLGLMFKLRLEGRCCSLDLRQGR